jgi:hypothetical protein
MCSIIIIKNIPLSFKRKQRNLEPYFLVNYHPTQEEK